MKHSGSQILGERIELLREVGTQPGRQHDLPGFENPPQHQHRQQVKEAEGHGALPLSSLEQAEDSEKDAKIDLEAADQQLATLGVPKDHPSSIVMSIPRSQGL